MALTLSEICIAIKSDFKKRRITQQLAAETIGSTQQSIANQLSGKKRFSAKMAHKFSDAFGYSIEWLLFGEGVMYKDGMGTGGVNADGLPYYYLTSVDVLIQEGDKLRMAERLLEILNNKVAISAFRACLRGDYAEFKELCSILEINYCYIHLPENEDPQTVNALRRAREFSTLVETQAAKELVAIEQAAMDGKLILVDEEIKRFRKKVLKIKKDHLDDAVRKNPDLDIPEYLKDIKGDSDSN